MPVRREIDVQASPEEVWEALADEERRSQWLGEPEREIEVEQAQEPSRLVWWWSDGQQAPTRVEFSIVALPAGARITVTESVPAFPLPALALAVKPQLVPA